ncbi:MAG TPA: NINE protein [Saprospiraceae bacterium]|nr:NINE protein [Saprospiraceae bacterium]
MKDKNVAAILAFFLGGFGIHRFYLGQIGLGIFYILFFWISWFIGFIDFIVLLAMDQKEFDFKYNRNFIRPDYLRSTDTDFDRRRNPYDRNRRDYYRAEERRKRKPAPRARRVEKREKPISPNIPKQNPYKISGVRKYKDYDFEGAIEDFKKVLAVNPKDAAVHFNIACAYSIMEEGEKAIYHLSEAVKNGFVDFNKIHEHDALAFVRIQDSFDEFVKNGYQLVEQKKAEPLDIIGNPDLLSQLKQLGELRDRGLLTEEEFQIQKKKILRI